MNPVREKQARIESHSNLPRLPKQCLTFNCNKKRERSAFPGSRPQARALGRRLTYGLEPGLWPFSGLFVGHRIKEEWTFLSNKGKNSVLFSILFYNP
jgi:hypothetical protein